VTTKSKRRKPRYDKSALAKSTHTNETKVAKTSIGGDNITVGNISGTGTVAIGRGAQATIQQGLNSSDLASLFMSIYQQIETRPEDPNVEKAELTQTVQNIEAETANGERANSVKIDRWLRNLAMMAPDILDVTIACLTSPLAGVASAVRKIATKAKEETAKAS